VGVIHSDSTSTGRITNLCLRLLPVLAVSAVVAGVVLRQAPDAAVATHSNSGVDNVSIDMDPNSAVLNTATSISTIQSCAQINNNSFLDADEDSPDQVLVDVVVGPAGIPIDRPLIAFQFELLFSPAIVSLASSDPNQLLMANPGSTMFDFSDTAPDNSGSFYVGVADIGFPPLAYETGPGVLARLALEGTGAGQSPLTFTALPSSTGIVFVDDQNELIPWTTVHTAAVAVDQLCDVDVDGIADAIDACPNLPGIPKRTVAAAGSPLAVSGSVGLLEADNSTDSMASDGAVDNTRQIAALSAGAVLIGAGGWYAGRRRLR
jgi:hypothetical protein